MKKSTLFFFLLVIGLLSGNLYLTWQNSEQSAAPQQQDLLNCRQLLKYANDLSTKKLFSVAADAYVEYADRCAQTGSDAAYTQLRLGELFFDAGDYEYALASYYKAESLDAAIKKHTGPKIVAALDKMNKSEEAAAEKEKQKEVGLKPEKSRGAAVARVGEETVYEDDVMSMTEELPSEMRKMSQTPQVKQMLIKQYVVQEAIAQRARRLGIDKDPLLERTKELMEKQLLVKAVLEKEVAEKAKVTDEEAHAAYEGQKQKFSSPAQVGIVYVEATDAAKAKAALGKKADVVWIDDTFTYIPGLGENEAAVAAIVKQDVGSVSAPISVGGKSYVVMVKEKKDGEVATFDEVKSAIIAALTKEKQQKETDAFVKRIFDEEDVQMYGDETEPKA